MNCCDYDAIVHYPPGSFSSQHKTVIVESVIEIDKDKTLSEKQVASFQNCEYKTFQIVKPIVLYRLYGRYQKEPKMVWGMSLELDRVVDMFQLNLRNR